MNKFMEEQTPLNKMGEYLDQWDHIGACCRNTYLTKNIYRVSYGQSGSEANAALNLFEITGKMNNLVAKPS